MIVRRIVKRSNFVVISINISNMIGNYIKHHPNSHWLSSLNHVLEVLLVSKIWIDFVPIKCCVAVIVITIVFWNRWNPDSVKTHSLNITELILNSFESATAVFGEIRTWLGGTISSPEPISNDLIYGSLFPLFLGLWCYARAQQSSNDKQALCDFCNHY